MTPRRKTSGGRPGPKKKKLGHFARQAGALRAWHSNKSHVAKNVTKSILSYDDCRVTGSEMKGIDVAKKRYGDCRVAGSGMKGIDVAKKRNEIVFFFVVKPKSRMRFVKISWSSVLWCLDFFCVFFRRKTQSRMRFVKISGSSVPWCLDFFFVFFSSWHPKQAAIC